MAYAIIYFFVTITIAFLAWIILYVLVRGFYAQNKVTGEFAETAEKIISQAADPQEEFIFIINHAVRVNTLSVTEIRQLYTKNRNYWGPFSGQNLKAIPIIYAADDSLNSAVRSFILGKEKEYSKHVKPVASVNEMINHVEKTTGAIGYIGARQRGLLEKRKVKILNVRRIVFPVNPSVMKIVCNKQLGSVTLTVLEKIFAGKITNWQQAGGIDLPVNPILGKNDAYEKTFPQDTAMKNQLPVNTEFVQDTEELCARVQQREGAFGVCFYNDLPDQGIPLLSIEYTIAKINLDFHYIIEAPAESGAWGGISTIVLNTLFLIIFTLLFSAPVGICAAVYLVEYSRQTRLVRLLRLGVETLAGIPSILFGLFGFIFFVIMLKLGIGFISAVLTVTMMVLPTIIRTSEEALKAVSPGLREASMSLGATKLQTVFRVVLPAASPGILSGVILALGRTVGETAVLIYTMGSNYELVRSPNSSARVLSLHLYNMFAEAVSFDRCFATATVLIFIILVVNLISGKLIDNFNKKTGRNC